MLYYISLHSQIHSDSFATIISRLNILLKNLHVVVAVAVAEAEVSVVAAAGIVAPTGQYTVVAVELLPVQKYLFNVSCEIIK